MERWNKEGHTRTGDLQNKTGNKLEPTALKHTFTQTISVVWTEASGDVLLTWTISPLWVGTKSSGKAVNGQLLKPASDEVRFNVETVEKSSPRNKRPTSVTVLVCDKPRRRFSDVDL